MKRPVKDRLKWLGAMCLFAQLLACAGGARAVRENTSLKEAHEEPELLTVTHQVTNGQTLYRIAKAYRVSVEELMVLNGITDASQLQPGTRLLIPGATSAVEVPNTDSVEPHATTQALPPAVKGPVRVGRPNGSLSWPLRGVLYARFGRKGAEAHDGIDLAAPEGTPVKTAAPGEVLFAGDQKGYGLIVIVEHPNQLVTLYAHNRDLRVKTGQTVRDGQVIATVGESGATSGPHLHFEVRQDGRPVDPLEHLGPVPPPEK